MKRTIQCLFGTSCIVLATALPVAHAQTQEPMVVGSILDETGGLNVYGTAMVQATRLAIEDINQAGGVLGRPLKLIAYDAQSDNAKYTTYANQLTLRDKAVVIMGGSAAHRVKPSARWRVAMEYYTFTMNSMKAACATKTCF